MQNLYNLEESKELNDIKKRLLNRRKNNLNLKKWLKTYEVAEKYYAEHGNLIIYKNDNIDKETLSLEAWLSGQRTLYKEGKLEEEKIYLLNKLDMVWDKIYFKKLNNALNHIYNLYQQNMLKEEDVDLLIKEDFLTFSDDAQIKRGSALKINKSSKRKLFYEEKGHIIIKQI